MSLSVRPQKIAFFVIKLRNFFDFLRFRPNLADFIRIASSLHLFDVDFPPFDPKASTFAVGPPRDPRKCPPRVGRLTRLNLRVSSHFISSHLTSSHLADSHLVYSHLVSSHLMSSHLVFSHLISSQPVCSQGRGVRVERTH